MSEPAAVPSASHRSPRRRLRVDRRWTWHYQTLVALRDHLVQEQRAPQSTDWFDRDFIRALLSRESDPLGEINAAIDRILRGEYGSCELTGARIAPARLRATPWLRRGSGSRPRGVKPPGVCPGKICPGLGKL